MNIRRSLPFKLMVIAIAALILAVIGIIIFLNRNYDSTTMRLIRTEGVIILEDSNGNAKFLDDNRRFESGIILRTGVNSIASVAVDDSKTVTLEPESAVQFIKTTDNTRINMVSGGIFFEMNRFPQNTSININALSIHLGNSSGYIKIEDDGTASIIITSGTAHAEDDLKQIDVSAGHKLTVQIAGGADYTLESIAAEDLPSFLLDNLLDRWELRDTICTQTGWNSETLFVLAGGVIEEPQTEETEETEETEAAPTPTPRPTSTPTPSPTPTTAPVIYYDPAPEETAAPEQTEAPAPEQTEAPAPEQTEAPAPEQTEAPAPEQTEAPAPEQTEAPAPEQTEAPQTEQTEAPAPQPEVQPEQPQEPAA